jgi:GcrA cell cycle regulator
MLMVLPTTSRIAHVWHPLCAAKLVALYQDPARFPLEVIAAQLNLEFAPARSAKACSSKIQSMGLADRNSLDALWPQDRTDRLIALYESASAPSYQIMAETLNREFGTELKRNAVCGKINRLRLNKRGLPAARDTADRPKAPAQPRQNRTRERYDAGSKRMRTIIEAVDAPELRVVELEPRAPRLTIVDLERPDCRWPVASEGDTHFFCGHPQHGGSSYCRHHRMVGRGRGTESERAASRMVAA